MGLCCLEALVYPRSLISDRCKSSVGVGKSFGSIDCVLRMHACAEHIVPKTVKLYSAAPATTVNFDVVPALIAVWQTSREA
jgi:hypothetical protein